MFDPDQEPQELDDAIREAFPNALWVGQKYFLLIPDAAPRQVVKFADWLTTTFDDATS